MSFLFQKRWAKSDATPQGGTARRFHDPSWLIPRVLTKLYSLWIRVANPFASLGHNVSLHYTCDVIYPGLICLGNSTIVQKDVWLHALPQNAERTDPALIIEDSCVVSRRSHIVARNCVQIERGVMVSASVYIADTNHAYADVSVPIREQGMSEGGRIRIGQGSWIGQNAVIICEKGELTLGRNCVVAANAVVTRSVPPYSVLAGNPARIIKQYDPAKGIWVLGASVGAEKAAPPVVVCTNGVPA